MKLETTSFYSPRDLQICSLVQALCKTTNTNQSAEIEFKNEFKTAFLSFNTANDTLYASLAVLLKCFNKEDWLRNQAQPVIIIRQIMNGLTVETIAHMYVQFRIRELHYGNENQGVSEFIAKSLIYFKPAEDYCLIRESFSNEVKKFFDQAVEDYSDYRKKMNIMFCGGKSLNKDESFKDLVARLIHEEKRILPLQCAIKL